MGQNIRLVLDIFNEYKNNDKQGTLMSLDLAKAFDTLEWNFIIKTLQFFNFGDTFISWIKLLYNEPLCHIKNNGHLSKQIHISRGIRQDCPVSSLVLILAAESLATKIRSSSSIKGIEIGNKDKYVKLSQ